MLASEPDCTSECEGTERGRERGGGGEIVMGDVHPPESIWQPVCCWRSYSVRPTASSFLLPLPRAPHPVLPPSPPPCLRHTRECTPPVVIGCSVWVSQQAHNGTSAPLSLQSPHPRLPPAGLRPSPGTAHLLCLPPVPLQTPQTSHSKTSSTLCYSPKQVGQLL